MAISPKSKKKLKDAKPDDFLEKFRTHLKIRYVGEDRDGPRFEYSFRKTDASVSAAGVGLIKESGWQLFFANGKRTEGGLDIDIDGDTLVTVETIDNLQANELFWYVDPQKDLGAMMLEEEIDSLYGDLKYSNNGNDWYDLEDYPHPNDECRLIQFKVNFNNKHSYHPLGRHKFSYNVLLKRLQKPLEYYEIDPDIKNPSV